MTNNSAAGMQLPGFILDSLSRHLSKLREATTAFPVAPQGSLTWVASPGLQDALGFLLQSGERVRDTSTKFSLVLSTAPVTSSIKAISDEIREACDTLVASLGVLVDAHVGAGPPLMEAYCQQVRSILRATEELVKHASSSSILLPTAASAAGTNDSLAPKTGVIWAACEQLGKLPKSNKVGFRRAILKHQSAVRDTLREFREMLEQQEQQEEDDEDNEEGEEGSGEAQGSSSSAAVQAVADGIQDLGLEDDYFFSGGDETLRGWERENVSRALVALGHAGDLLKAVLGAVDEATQGPEAGGQMVMQTIARMEESCQVLTAAVVNAADACYPPQLRQELDSQLDALVAAAIGAATTTLALPHGPAVALCQEEAEKVKQAAAVGLLHDGEEEEREPVEA